MLGIIMAAMHMYMKRGLSGGIVWYSISLSCIIGHLILI